MGRGRGGEGTMHQEMGGQIMVQGVWGGGGGGAWKRKGVPPTLW